MNAKDEKDLLEQMQQELTPVVTVPAPGGELTIAISKQLPEAEQLKRAETVLLGMIESAEAALENPRPCVSNKLLTRPSQLAQGLRDVAKRHEYVTRHKETLDLLHDTSRSAKRAADNAAIAAARNLKELKGKSAGGRKGAAIAKAERGEDTERKAILDEAKKLLEDWDRRYPNRHKKPIDSLHSNRAAFRIVANRHRGEDGKPIKSIDAIERAVRREKAKNEKRGKYPRTGKKRGKYKART